MYENVRENSKRICAEINAKRDVKSMTRKTIKNLLAIIPDDPEVAALVKDFEREYGEKL